jgi:hypothetical protein
VLDLTHTTREHPFQSGWPCKITSSLRRHLYRLYINKKRCSMVLWIIPANPPKWSPIVCLLLLTVMKSPEKYECGSLQIKISECGRFYAPAMNLHFAHYAQSTFQNWQMTLYAHLFVPNKIKIWNIMSIVLTQRYWKRQKQLV